VATFSMAISIAMHNERAGPYWVQPRHCMSALPPVCDWSQWINGCVSGWRVPRPCECP
jgi:hypothetical protein